MEPGCALGAVAVMVALVMLGAHPASGEMTTGFFQEMAEHECQFFNGTERVRYINRLIYNGQQYLHFDSDLGHCVADLPMGKATAEHWNSQPDILEYLQGSVEKCLHNYDAHKPFTVDRRVQPKVTVTLVQSSSLPESKRLACYVTGFYPPEVEVKWFKNGQEETDQVVSTDVMQNGDWTYQVLVMLESTPERGDTYVCQVEHISLQHPISQHWELQGGAGRSKMLTGVGGCVLGLVFLALGLFIYVRKKKGRVGRPLGVV
ncbi:class II histocompatibility antigen, B-L beta chain-like [Indicator indicator]|uniref:class II histocompatibility antigen, B-L beta chain-like n=1 Tax=Indicator indicator TaxID=1002788 RepID=UPI0023DF4306|nr:class II histocompatibility antigen, B-L beta chain-like [Indicator indicator]